MNTKVQILNKFEDDITKLQNRLDETELALTNATKDFQKEQEDAKEREQQLGVELAEKKMHLSEREKELQVLKDDAVRKDEMYLTLAREKRDLEQNLLTFKKDSFSNLDKVIAEKNAIIERVRTEQVNFLREVTANIETIQGEKQAIGKEIVTKNEENSKLKKELENVTAAINNKEDSLKSLETVLSERDNAIKKLQDEITKKDALVIDKDCDIEILNEDLKFYQNQVIEMENKVKSIQSSATNRSLQEEKLKMSHLIKEVGQLQELIREKDKVIAQMTEDHKQVHANLRAIDNKIKESGNILDLSNRLVFI